MKLVTFYYIVPNQSFYSTNEILKYKHKGIKTTCQLCYVMKSQHCICRAFNVVFSTWAEVSKVRPILFYFTCFVSFCIWKIIKKTKTMTMFN